MTEGGRRGLSIERAGGQTPLVRNRQIFAKGEVDGEWGGSSHSWNHPPTLPPADECMYSDPLLMMTVAINGRFGSPPLLSSVRESAFNRGCLAIDSEKCIRVLEVQRQRDC